jgi:hypothetical protein
MTHSFEEILKMPATAFPDPIPIPAGTYHCIVEAHPEPGRSSQKQTPFFAIKFKIMNAMEDVDKDQANAANVVGKVVTEQFYATTEAMPRYRRFLEHLGIDTSNTKTPIEELNAEVRNKQVLIKIGHEASQDGTRVFTRVRSTAAV